MMASRARLSGERRVASERHSRRAVSRDADRPKGLYYYRDVRLKADTTDATGLKACTTPANVRLKPGRYGRIARTQRGGCADRRTPRSEPMA